MVEYRLDVSGVEGSNPSMSIETKGDIAHLGERLICTQKVAGSSPVISTMKCKKHNFPRITTTKKLKEDKREEFLAMLKEWGLFQLTDEGMLYFFEEDTHI